jgi:hypothetical protein
MKFFLFSLFFSLNIFAYNTAEIQKVLLEVFSGEPIFGDLFKLTVKGFPLQVYIKPEFIGQPGEKVPTIISIHTVAGGDCLILQIEQDSAHLGWLATKMAGVDRKCGIPDSIEKKGEFLLSFVDSVARTLKLRSVTLDDVSRIHCPKNKEDLSLKLLRLVKGSAGWYEQHGFVPTEIKRHERAASLLMNFSIKEIISVLDNISSEFIEQTLQEITSLKQRGVRPEEAAELITYWSNFQRRKELLKEQVSILKATTFSEAAGPLYREDGSTCDLYSDIINLIIPPTIARYKDQSKIFESFGWLEIYNEFRDSGMRLEKRYSSVDSQSDAKQ